MKRSFADILQGLDSDRAQKVARKLPEWAAAGAEIPSALSLEQCSSSATAGYKASLAAELIVLASRGESSPDVQQQPADGLSERWGFEQSKHPGRPILDLTGGLGVDSWALSRVAERVVYFEREATLAEAAKRNFERLGAANIEVRCETVTPGSELPEADLIYADPARRDAAGRKVFRLEDCTPDILTLLPTLLRKAPAVLLKLSPMADLTMLTAQLGPALREIHVVELDGEVKEILCLLCGQCDFLPLHPLEGDGTQDAVARVRQRTLPAEPEIVLALLTSAATASGNLATLGYPIKTCFSGGPTLGTVRGRGPSLDGRGPTKEDVSGGSWPLREAIGFRLSEEREAEVRYAAELRPGDLLLEPCAALLKAGAFRLPCSRWGLLKLAPSTHLYTGHIPEAAPWFKAWRIREVLPFGAAAFKELRQRYPKAEVTARNLPLGSEALQKKMGISPGGNTHLFGCRLADGRAVLLATETM